MDRSNRLLSFINTSRRLLIFGIGPAVLVFAFFIAHKEGFFKIDKVDLVLAQEHQDDPGQVPMWLGPLWKKLNEELQSRQNKDIWSAEEKEMSAIFEQHPWVQKWSMIKKWPDTLEFSIHIKPLVAYGKTPKGNLVPLFSDGRSIANEQLGAALDLPLISIPLDNFVVLNRALEILATLPKNFSERISELAWDAKEGFSTLVNPFATQVKWGDKISEQQVQRVTQVMSYLDQRQLGARVIDANLAKKVVVRLRKSP